MRKTYIVGVMMLAWTVPAAAQQRGTVEFGAFGSAASFDKALTLTHAIGGGGRVGVYLDPRWSLEFEDAEMRAKRPGGLKSVNVGILSGRLVAVPVKAGAVSLLLGGGAGVSTETNFLHSYGVDALVGAKFALSNSAALRVDGVWDWLANEKWKTYRSVRVGLSLYRHPSERVRTVTVTTPAPPPVMMAREDSVSAAETRRLRDQEAALRALRDSLRTAPAPVSAADMATMQVRILFAFDKSDLTDSAKAILNDKVQVFQSNKEMTVIMRGFTDVTGTDAYNMALGTRRAEAVKGYLVGRGVDASRIAIESYGKRQQVGNATGAAGEARNRRAVFEVLIGQDERVKK